LDAAAAFVEAPLATTSGVRPRLREAFLIGWTDNLTGIQLSISNKFIAKVQRSGCTFSSVAATSR
jgi:hypothetical protein